jgi:hypothetical protein
LKPTKYNQVEMAGERGRKQRPFSCHGKDLGKTVAVAFIFQGAAGAMLKLVKVAALALKADAAGHPSLRLQIARSGQTSVIVAW